MSYIEDYMLTTENSQPPFEYHSWCMLSTLSAFAGRRFWFPFGPLNFYPNLYVLLVGDPGIAKTTAMNRAKDIVRASQICPVAATKITKEALCQEMTGTEKKPFTGKKFFDHPTHGKMEYNQYAIFASELTTFISVDPLGFLDFLTVVWDESILEVKTKNMGNDYVVGPYITLLGCMTPEIVKGFLKMNILQGGFARRTAMVYSGTSNLVPIPSYTPEQREAEKRCVQFGKDLQTKSGAFDWTPALQQFYNDWFYENARAEKDRPPSTRGWYKSKGEMLFKLAMLASLANDGGESLMLDVPHYKAALFYCGLVEKNLERVFEGTGINPNAAAISQVIRMLEQLDLPMNRKHLVAMFMDNVTNLREFEDSLSHLIACGRLAEKVLTVTGTGQLLGSVIATPACLARYKVADLAAFLSRRDAQPDSSSNVVSPSASPTAVPRNQLVDSLVIQLRGIETQLTALGDEEARSKD